MLKRNVTRCINLLAKVFSFYYFSKRPKVSTSNDTCWVYHSQLANFAWTHMISIVLALIKIYASNNEGSDAASSYVMFD